MVPFVQDIQVSNANEPDVIYLRALHWASYRKCVKYKVQMIVNPQGSLKILSALCDKSSPPGCIGCCCHVMAVIWKLNEMSRNKLKKPIHDDVLTLSGPVTRTVKSILVVSGIANKFQHLCQQVFLSSSLTIHGYSYR